MFASLFVPYSTGSKFNIKCKYSPNYPHKSGHSFEFNCFSQTPAPWTNDIEAMGIMYNVKTMYGCYDNEGFDSYGYSAFDKNGTYMGIGEGIDRNGLTEQDYLVMDSEEFADYL